MPRFILTILCIAIISANCENQVGSKDTYLNAYKVSHGLNSHLIDKNDRESTYFPDKNEYPYPVYNKPAEDYGPPKDNYGPPKDSYGPPQNSYGPPQNSYFSPKPVYGPPSYNHNIQSPAYGPPEPFYGMPHAMLGILDKIKLKLDLFTIAKIVLKLVIFKKIVSLIAILCLLLFIPSLKHHDKEEENHHDDDEMRMIRNTKAQDHINRITSIVTESLEKFGKQNKTDGMKCSSIYCKSTKIINYFEKKLPYNGLIDMYTNEFELAI